MSNSVNVANMPAIAGNTSSRETIGNSQDSTANEFAALLQSAQQQRGQRQRAASGSDDPARAKAVDAPEAKSTQAKSTGRQSQQTKPDDVSVKATDESSTAESAATESFTKDNPLDDCAQADEPLSDAAAQVLLMMGLGPITTPTPVAVATPVETQNPALAGIAGVVTTPAVVDTAIMPTVTVSTPTPTNAVQTTGGSAVNTALTDTHQGAETATPLGENAVSNLLTGKLADDATSPTVAQLQSQLQAQLLGAQHDKVRTDELGTAPTAPDLLSAISGMGNLVETQSGKDVSTMNNGSSSVINAPVGSAGWAPELGSKLVVLAKHDVAKATLYVTPNDLGPVRIQIETQQNQTSVWFTADHPDTRSAIEQSLPKLRELFQAQGMNLNDAGVFSGSSGQQATKQSPQGWANTGVDTQADVADTVTVRTLSLKLVDAYV